jgi:N-methylhydantoinase B/oxoprolinase/acetone carboxylase alpha subunit
VTHVIDTGAVTPGSMSTGQNQRFGDGYMITCRRPAERHAAARLAARIAALGTNPILDPRREDPSPAAT